MKIINFIIWLSIAALVGVLLARFIFGQGAATFDLGQTPKNEAPVRIVVHGGVSGNWMSIERANKSDLAPVGEGGFDPSYTYILVDFKPLVKKLRNGRYEIQFTAEIAEDIP